MTDGTPLRATALLLSSCALSLTGCPSKERVEAAPGPEHCGDITGVETWRAGAGIHRVTCDVHVEGGSLTLEAGTRVRFASGTGLYVSSQGRGGTLVVAGTASQRVHMALAPAESGTTPPTPVAAQRGEWTGILALAGSTRVALEGLDLEGAGGRRADAAITLDSTTATLRDVSITRTEGCGLLLRGGRAAGLDPSSGGIVSSDAQWPACADIDNAHTLPARATGSDYTGNDLDHVLVEGGTLTEPVSWDDLGVPYEMKASLAIRSDAGSAAQLTLEAGVRVLFPMSRSLSVEEGAGLITQGTAESPVVLGPVEDNGRGSWIGLGIGNAADSSRIRLQGTVIEGAGYVPYPTVPGSNLHVDGASPLLENVTLRGSSGYGFRFTGGATFAEGSHGVTIADCGGAGILDASTAHSFPEDGAAIAGNDTDAVEIEHGSIDASGTWGDPGVPYLVRGGISVDGQEGHPAVLTIEPGTTVEFEGGGIGFSSYGGPSGLLAVGTPERPITFTGRRAGVPEQQIWHGITLADGVVDASCRLEHVDIGFGGGNAWTATNLGLTGASPTLSSVLIHDSVGYGLALDRNSMPAMSDVTFARNASGDVTMR